MKKCQSAGAARRGAAVLVFLAAAWAGSAQTSGSARLEAGGALLDGRAAGTAALSGSFEAFGDITAARFSASLQGRAGDGLAGSGEVRSELSLSLGPFVSVLTLGGGLSAQEGERPSWKGSCGLLASVQGMALSLALSGGFERRSDAGLLSNSASLGLETSVVAGELLLKPRLDASLSLPDAGGQTWTFLPGLGLSWYPGIPLATSLGAGFRRAIDSSGYADSFLANASVYGALGPLFATLDGDFAAGPKGITGATLAAGLSLEPLRGDGFALSLPIRVTWVLGGTPALSLFAGLGLALD